ncbi:MAG: M48 family metallopeptidase [Oscillospiraceae bacterium]
MEYELIKSRKRRTIEMSINDEGKLVIRAPQNMEKSKIDAFVEKHRLWAEKHIKLKKERIKKYSVSPEEEENIKKNALPYLKDRTEYFSAIMGLEPTGVKITSAKKRFGSCSAKNSICYSWRLMLYPKEAIDYVVVHELAHIAHKNHGPQFYALIEKYLPDYKEREKLLR